MKRVAAEAGMTPGILHYYFRDKRAILGRAAATVMADLDRRVALETRGVRDARGQLRALLRACLKVATESRDFWTVFIELWGEALHDRELARLNRLHLRARPAPPRGTPSPGASPPARFAGPRPTRPRR